MQGTPLTRALSVNGSNLIPSHNMCKLEPTPPGVIGQHKQRDEFIAGFSRVGTNEDFAWQFLGPIFLTAKVAYNCKTPSGGRIAFASQNDW